MATGEQDIVEEGGGDPLKSKFDAPSFKTEEDSTEETCPILHQKFENLFMEVPSLATMDTGGDSGISKLPQISSHSPKRVAFSSVSSPSTSNTSLSPGRPFLSEIKSNSRGITSNMNFQYPNLTPAVEMSPIVPFKVSRAVASPWPRLSRSRSLTKLFSPKLNTASDSESSHGGSIIEPPISTRELAQRSIRRSYSVPVIREDGSILLRGNTVCLIPSSPQISKEIVIKPYKSPTYDNDKNIDSGMHSSDEVVCRICLIELGNGLETIKMECNCKGELALAHQECAIKWFSTKGNRICDVCRQEVHNLSITLLRAYAVQTYNFQESDIVSADITQYRVWQDVPLFVFINILAYFSFLEQLLAAKMGLNALAISLPYSCIFGLLASMSALTMVSKQYIWIYAIVQLALVIAFSHVFYSKLDMQVILGILVATLSGFVITMTLTTILEKILRRTRPWLNQSTHQTPSEMQSDGLSTITMQANPSLGLQRGPEEPMQPRTSPATSRGSRIDLPDEDIEMGISGAFAAEADHISVPLTRVEAL